MTYRLVQIHYIQASQNTIHVGAAHTFEIWIKIRTQREEANDMVFGFINKLPDIEMYYQ